ncbi:MAG: hypothetical protein JW915_25300 [Chitinispirillaceae bacterium]|nr:hypothetical protein [Chitinispirillaceae bacterium]
MKHLQFFIISKSGYSLLEVTIALALLFFTLAPLSVMIHRNNALIHARQEIIAMCLLEQEIARAKCRSLNILPVQRRVINNAEWIITSEVSGDKLKTVTMVASLFGKERGRSVFYEFTDQ